MRGLDDGGQETAVAADLVKCPAVGQCENECASTAAVQQSEAILGFKDIQVRPDFAIDDHGIAEEFGVPDGGYVSGVYGVSAVGAGVSIEVFPGGGVEEAAVGIEAAVLDGERHFERATWQVECSFGFIAEEVEAGESGVDVESGGAHGVVMVPECGRGLIVVVDVVAAAARNVPMFGEAVMFRAGVTAVEMCDGANFGVRGIEHVVVSAIECRIDGEEVFCGQCAGEADTCSDAALGFDGDSGVAAVVAPDCGQRQATVQAGLELGHGDGGGGFRVGSNDGWDRQRIDEFCEYRCIDRHGQCGGAGGL